MDYFFPLKRRPRRELPPLPLSGRPGWTFSQVMGPTGRLVGLAVIFEVSLRSALFLASGLIVGMDEVWTGSWRWRFRISFMCICRDTPPT